MLRLITQEDIRDIYEFENEINDDTRKSQFVYVDWHNNIPHANHPTTMISYMVEVKLKKTGRQTAGSIILEG
jgi:hypothetical protein